MKKFRKILAIIIVIAFCLGAVASITYGISYTPHIMIPILKIIGVLGILVALAWALDELGVSMGGD